MCLALMGGWANGGSGLADGFFEGCLQGFSWGLIESPWHTLPD